MSEIYTVIIVILGILAVSGLFVGVTNDAVNFLNSSIMPLEVSTPTMMPTEATVRIVRIEAAFEPMAELRKLTAAACSIPGSSPSAK